MNLKPTVYIVTAIKDDWFHTKKLITCIKKQSYKNIKVIIVDDGSVDGSGQKIKKLVKNCVILTGNGELWWTGSMYNAFEYVLKEAKQNDYILTINNDCVFGNNYIRSMLKTATSNPKAVIGSQVIDLNDHANIIGSSANINWLRGSIFRTPNNEEIQTLTTRGTLFPVYVVIKVGNFNFNKLPHYGSDIEYTYRIWRHGYRLIVNDKCIVYLDVKRTGISGPQNHPYTFSQIKDKLFNRKSQINIIDHYYLIKLCCPWYFRPQNYLFLLGKILYLVSYTKPFFKYRKPLVYLRNLLIDKTND